MAAAPPYVVITRPAIDAQAWCQSLQNGLQLSAATHAMFCPIALPLMAFAPMPPSTALPCMDGYQAVMWVSAQAVRAWGQQAHFSSATRHWATGPATAAAIVQHGVPMGQIDQPAAESAQFDSEALWHTVQHQLQAGQRVLVVRGTDAPHPNTPNNTPHAAQAPHTGRNWLAKQCQALGAVVDEVVVYQRQCPAWTAAHHAMAGQVLQCPSLWVLHSSQSVRHLQQLLPQAQWHTQTALATHPRIAHTARQLLPWQAVDTVNPQFAHVQARIAQWVQNL